MALIGLLGPDEEARRDLCLAIEELGHRVSPARELRQAVDFVRRERPRAMVVLDEIAEPFLGEAERVSPLLPVIVAQTRRDASRAVELMKAGAYEVVAPPWTRESLSACLSKALRFPGTILDPARPPSRRRAAWLYLLAAGAFLGVALGIATLERRRRLAEEAARPVPSEWELPYAHPAGMAFHKGEFWVGDWYSQTVNRHDPATRVLSWSAPFPRQTPVALVFVGDALWTVNAPGEMARHMLDERLTVLSRAPGLLPHTVGLAYDGLYLWTLNSKVRRINQHLLDDRLTLLKSFRYPGVKPAALAFDGKTLWSLDAGDRELLRHDLEDPRSVLFRAPLKEYQGGLWRPTGLAWDGAAFWSVAESVSGRSVPGRIIRHAIELPGGRRTLP